MEFLIGSFVLCLLFTFLWLHFIARGTKTTTKGKLLPGPPPLPIIGNLFHLGDKPHKSLAKLSNTYGPIITLKLGRITTVVVSSSDLAKEILQTHDLTLSNRNVIDAFRAHQHHEDAMAWLPVGPRWRNLRKVCNSHLFTTQKLDANEGLRQKKVQELLADVQELCRAGEAVDIGRAAFKTTLNALSNMVLSLDLTDGSSETAREFKELVSDVMDEAGKSNLGDFFPAMRRLDLQGIRRRMGVAFGKIMDLFDGMIEERLRLRKLKGYVAANDMLDTLLSISEENSEDMDAYRIKNLFLDLFVAGTDTTSNTLEWAMAELIRNPETLSRARMELEQTIGKDKLLEESDITRLPYLQAIIKETFRLHPAVPLLLPRKAAADVEIHGFMVPKGAQIMVNAWAIGRDPCSWKDPLMFFPERFLGSDVDARGRNFELIPFGAGRRICPGLPLAIRMLHLMLGSLVQSFDWKLEEGVSTESLDMEEKFGITLQMARPLRAVPLEV